MLAICSQHLSRKYTVFIIGIVTQDQVFADFASLDNFLTFGTIIIWKRNTRDIRKGMTQSVGETEWSVVYDAPHNLMWEEQLDGKLSILWRRVP